MALEGFVMGASSLFINSLIAAVGVLAFYMLIPLLQYLEDAKEGSFKDYLRWLGIYRAPRGNLRQVFLILLAVSVVAFGITSAVIFSGHSGRYPGETREGFTTSTFLIYLAFYGLRPGIGEEIFFRGFVARGLIHSWGFLRGNLFQALFFGIMHYAPTAPTSTVADQVARVLAASIMGYACGYVMSKKTRGSIVPLIIAHTLYNIFSMLLFGALGY